MNELINFSMLLNGRNLSRIIIEGYSYLYDLLAGWYPEILYSRLYKRWIAHLFAKNFPSQPVEWKFYVKYVIGEDIPESLCSLVANRIMTVAVLVLCSVFVGMLSYRKIINSGFSRFSLFFKFMTFYILLAIPFRHSHLASPIRTLVSSSSKLLDFVLFNVAVLLAFASIFFFFKNTAEVAVKKDRKKSKKVSREISIALRRDSGFDERIDFQNDPSSRIYTLLKNYKRPQEYCETLLARIGYGILIAAAYLCGTHMILSLVGESPMFALVILTGLVALCVFSLCKIIGNSYNNGLVYNYVSLYLFSFILLLVQVLSVVLIILTAFYNLLPNAHQKLLYGAENVLHPLFLQNIGLSSILPQTLLLVAFMLYCIFNTENDDDLEFKDKIKKYHKIFENFKIYLRIAKSMRSSLIRYLYLPLVIAELCLKMEHKKLAKTHLQTTKKLTALEFCKNRQESSTFRPCNSRRPSILIVDICAEGLNLDEQISLFREQRDALFDLYVGSCNLKNHYFCILSRKFKFCCK